MLLGVDVGGTFTDAALLDGDRLHTAKVPSTPDDQSRGVIAAIEEVLGRAGAQRRGRRGLHPRDDRRDERPARGARRPHRAGRDQGVRRPARHRPPGAAEPVPPLPRPAAAAGRGRRLRFEAAERIGVTEVLEELADEEVGRLVEELRAARAESVAVCLLFAFRDPSHERRIASALREALPDLHVSASHEVLPAFREFERFSTTVIDAYLSPLLGRYLTRLAGACRDEVAARAGGDALLRRHGGGRRGGTGGRLERPLGPGGRRGRRRAAREGRRAAPTRSGLDMGGTSCDVCVVDSGEVRRTDSREIEGRPVQLPMVDVHTVGAGGGSIAWRDAGGALRVGPRSAGADPGPACYGRGGTEPTVTDANLLLGYLSPDSQLAGGVALDAEAARSSVASLGERARPRRDRDGRGDRAGRQPGDDPRAASGHRRARSRSARLRAAALRRRRPDARRSTGRASSRSPASSAPVPAACSRLSD